MSTYWYMECLDHAPTLRSADEVEQHTNENLDIIGKIDRAAISERGREAVIEEWGYRAPGWNPYFIRHAVNFLADHPKCAIRLVSEYGEVRTVTPAEAHVESCCGVLVVSRDGRPWEEVEA